MVVKNKLEKFLIGLSGFFALALFVMGIKVADSNKKLDAIQNDLAMNPADPGSGPAIQNEIGTTRDAILNKAAHSPESTTKQTTVIRTVIPGKVITQTVPVSSSGSSNKTTKTS